MRTVRLHDDLSKPVTSNTSIGIGLTVSLGETALRTLCKGTESIKHTEG